MGITVLLELTGPRHDSHAQPETNTDRSSPTAQVTTPFLGQRAGRAGWVRQCYQCCVFWFPKSVEPETCHWHAAGMSCVVKSQPCALASALVSPPCMELLMTIENHNIGGVVARCAHGARTVRARCAHGSMFLGWLPNLYPVEWPP